MRYPLLLQPTTAGDFALPNRMVMSPMTRFRVDECGVPSPLNAVYYSQRATAGLIVSETVYTEPHGRLSLRTAGLYTPDQVRAWSGVTQTVREKGGRMFAQLCHAGRVTHPVFMPNGDAPVCPSPVAQKERVRVGENPSGDNYTDAVLPRELSRSDIQDIIAGFRRGAERARDAGFDGVELHAGSGLLHHQFLASCVNHRTDAYGGSSANRCRFIVETLEALCEVRGSGRVGVKIAPNFAYHDIQSDEAEIRDTYICLAQLLTPLNLAYVHVQYPPWRLFTGPADLNPIDLVRPHYRGTLIGAGEFDRHTGEAALRAGRCDLIAYGRRFIANPDLPSRFRLDAEENGWDESTLYTPTPEGFVDYATI